MRAVQYQHSFSAPPRCARCDEVIGVYEPLVLVEDDAIRVTSRAAEPSVALNDGIRYHAACHEASSLGDAL